MILPSDDRLERTRHVADQALAQLAAWKIPPTPEMFALAHCYVTGAMPDVVREIDRQLAEAGRLDEAAMEALHRRFLSGTQEQRATAQLGQGIGALIKRLEDQLASLHQSGQSYAGQLGGARAAIAEASDLDQLGELIRGVLSETQAMETRIEHLEADLASHASELEAMRQELHSAVQQARSDALTGLANRRRFDPALHAAILGSRARHGPISLILADIDHFKKFNDMYGHATGDKVLQVVARLLTHHVKQNDLVARYGGEEFAILLPGSDVRSALAVADRLRELVGGRHMALSKSRQSIGRVTLSFGVAQHVPGESVSAWIGRADKALYAAKERGRNRVVAWEPEGH